MQATSKNYSIPCLLIFCAVAAGAQTLPHQDASQDATQAQTPAVIDGPSRSSEDWNRLGELTHQEEINVWASRNRQVHCLFTGATENFLFCEPRYPFQGGSEYRFDRADVDKVRLEQGERNFKRTIGLSALAGAVTGAALRGNSNSGDRVLGALAGGLGGTLVGVILAGPVALLTPGHLVYQRPRAQKSSNVSASVRTESSYEQVHEVQP